MELGTPIVQVLTGMTAYMKAHAAAAPSRRSILLLATDGVPDDSCTGTGNGNTPNTIENAVAKATEAFSGNPSIPTFVIGVGTELTALDQIATAGGTGKAILVDPIYTAKALAGLIAGVRSGAWDRERIVFWHAGGVPGLLEPLDP